MKVTINTYLNIRVGKPSVNAPCYQYLAPGSEIEVDGNLYTGDKYEGIDTWYKDEGGNYYWSGGVNKNAIDTIENGFNEFINYNKALKLPAKLTESKGKGIKVAVLDTGIYKDHPDFSNMFSSQFCTDVSRSKYGINDMVGHGTHCTGIIGARSNGKIGIVGVAPEAEIIEIKVAHEDFGPSAIRVAMGIEEAIKRNVDIINMSFQINDINNERIKKVIDEAFQKGIIMIASAGENELLLSDKKQYLYPAMFSSCIGIGVIDKYFTNKKFNAQLKYLMPYLEFYSCDIPANTNYYQRRGSSMAAAFLSGVTALILSSHSIKKNKETKDTIIKLLDENLVSLNEISFDSKENITIVKI